LGYRQWIESRTQQVEAKSILRKKTPPNTVNPFFNHFRLVKTMVKF